LPAERCETGVAGEYRVADRETRKKRRKKVDFCLDSETEAEEEKRRTKVSRKKREKRERTKEERDGKGTVSRKTRSDEKKQRNRERKMEERKKETERYWKEVENDYSQVAEEEVAKEVRSKVAEKRSRMGYNN